MKKPTAPEDDPLSVTLVAAQLMGRTCKQWEEAISQARWALKIAPRVIKGEKEDEEKMDARGFLDEGFDESVPERIFVDEMVKGLCTDKRFTRRKEFLFRMWPKLQAIDKNGPSLDAPNMFSQGILAFFQENFAWVCREHARKTRRANAKKPRRKRRKKIFAPKSKKSFASSLAVQKP